MESDERLAAFCRARERYLAAQRTTKDARAEQADAQRTLGALLRDSMAEHDVGCIAVPGASAGEPTRYVRVLRPSGASRRVVRPLKTVEDVLSLVEDVSRHMVSVSAEQLPDAIASLVLSRARQPPPVVGEVSPPPPASASLRFVKRPRTDEKVVPLEVAPRETRHLTQQYAKACEERSETRARMKPLREALRSAEKALVDDRPAPSPSSSSQNDPPPPSALVHVQHPDGRSLALRVTREEKAVKPRGAFGIRVVCNLVREAVRRTPRGDLFDARLREALRSLLEAERETLVVRTRLRVRTEKKAVLPNDP